MSRVFVPVGIIASGKSTACREWAEANDAVIVEADVLRTIFHRKYVYDLETEDIIWNVMVTAVAGWVDHEINVAVDDAALFLKKDNRIMFESQVAYATYLPYSWEWRFLDVPTDAQVAERRGREPRGYTVEEWVAAAQRQRKELEND